MTEPGGQTDDEVVAALDVARSLARVGVPVFLAYPSAENRTGYVPPQGWQRTVADPAAVDLWRPGLALCVLTGCGLDLVDLDPRNRPEHLGARIDLDLPDTWAMAYTPSGGVHHFVPPVGESSLDGKVEPGVDVKSGCPDGSGRGFAFVAPTVRRSKVTGEEHAYRWVIPPDVDAIAAEWSRLSWERPHPSTGPLRARMRAARATRRADPERPRRVPASVAAAERERVLRTLAEDLRRWAASGWGGEAHAGLLAATTYLARVDPESAEDGFLWAFDQAGVEPDEDDLAKLESAVDEATPDEVVPDAEMAPQELFWAGATVPEERLPREEPPPPSFLPEGPPPFPAAGGSESPAAGGARFRFLDEREVEAIPEPDPLVEGLLWSSTVARLFGASGTGKTWVAIDLAAHVARGLPWHGRATRRVPVLFVAAEGAPGLGLRLRTWRSRYGGDTGLMVWPEPVTVGGEAWPDFCAAAAAGGFGYVVLDTQAAMTVGYNENSNSDAAVVLRHLGDLVRVTGACVQLVHHTGNDEQERSRGASGMFGGLDTELRLTAQGARVTLHQDKQKYAERGRPTRLQLVRHGEGLVVEAPRAAPEDAAARQVEVMSHVAALEANHVDPGRSMRALLPYLRGELGRSGDSEVLQEAVRVFKHRAGVVGVVVPTYAADPSDLVAPPANGHHVGLPVGASA